MIKAFTLVLLAIVVPFSALAQTFGGYEDLPFLVQTTVVLTAGQTKASQWAARVVVNGGADPTGSETVALATFWDGLVTDGISTKMIQINHISPASKIAFTTPFLVGGGNDPWTAQCGNNNGSTLSLGVNGATQNGSGIANDTGIVDSTAFASDNDGGVTVYIYTTASEASRDFGYDNDALTTSFSFVGNAGGTVIGNCRSQVTGAIGVTPAGTLQGYWSMNRIGNTTFNIYFASSASAHASVGSSATGESGARQAKSIYAFGTHAIDHGTACTGFSTPTKTYSFFAIHNGLSSAESALFYARIQTLRTSLGGGAR